MFLMLLALSGTVCIVMTLSEVQTFSATNEIEVDFSLWCPSHTVL